MANFLAFLQVKSTGFSLKLIHRDSPDSPLYPGELTQLERFQRLAESSKSRAYYLHWLRKIGEGNSAVFPDIIRPPITRFTYIFTINASLGTPSRKRSFIFDTASAIVWTQCMPCTYCFQQKYPLFDPNTSSTYRKILSNHKLSKHFNCSKGECTYNIWYGSGQSSQGIASMETFAFQSSRKVLASIREIVFGCGNKNQGHFPSNTLVTGLMGMNKSPISLVSQLGSRIRQRFSYCLLSFNSSYQSTFLRFGSDIVRRVNVQRTPFINGIPDMYVVNLMDISVGGRRLGFKTGTFGRGCVIDSGSAVSHIELGAYNSVVKAFISHFERFNVTRVSFEPFRGAICFRFPQGFNNFPSMTFHFQGANLEVSLASLFLFIGNQLCLAIIGERGITILGAHQQQNVRFIYDLDNEKLSFVKEDCSKDKA
ncbi:unnamed protein product [Ilex paraguariensis]|uniref:Peptidase A1 domain-containing protein n=1 Tax=Ilex paraguariensis TaxID=185542 RepID=A0ABC8UAW8_9AQUA